MAEILDVRYKQIMLDLGMKNSTSLLLALKKVANEAVQLHLNKPRKVIANKYDVLITNDCGESMVVDAYDMIEAAKITCPALSHLAKKVLFTGQRGHKDTMTDLRDIHLSSKRAISLELNRVPK